MEATQKHMIYRTVVVEDIREIDNILNSIQPRGFSVSYVPEVGFLVILRMSSRRHYKQG